LTEKVENKRKALRQSAGIIYFYARNGLEGKAYFRGV
jgi:hypothetical protein